MTKDNPHCYIIAGPNGAGKTTFAMRYLPEIVGCRNFTNADLIAEGLSPFNSSSVQVEASRLYLSRIREQFKKGVDFAFETTLSGRCYIRWIHEIKNFGYRISLLYLWIRNADLSAARVKARVKMGGHDVPRKVIYRRYSKRLTNLFTIYEPYVKIATYLTSRGKFRF